MIYQYHLAPKYIMDSVINHPAKGIKSSNMNKKVIEIVRKYV